ncbi:hypothetical protein Q9966_000222 [Columba livia]|nr:hypothetical protein Q9966_000222 [Columba livia]
MPLAQLAEPWPNMELVQLDTENGQAAPEEGGNPPAKMECEIQEYLMVLAQLSLLSAWYLFILLPWWDWEKLHFCQGALCIPIGISREW